MFWYINGFLLKFLMGLIKIKNQKFKNLEKLE